MWPDMSYCVAYCEGFIKGEKRVKIDRDFKKVPNYIFTCSSMAVCVKLGHFFYDTFFIWNLHFCLGKKTAPYNMLIYLLFVCVYTYRSLIVLL